MEKQEYKMSVIIILYNTKEEYLKKSIESVINQTIKEIDIVLVNDGSKEEIAKICEKYKKQDKRITLINQENQGESVARNVGIKNAKSNNIMFVDSDDYIEENTCEKLINYIEKINNDFEMIFFDCYVEYHKKQVINRFYNIPGKMATKDIEELQLQNIDKGISKYYPDESNISVVWGKVYNKKFIEENNIKFIPNIVRMPDALFNMEVFEKINKIYYYPEVLYHYRKNKTSICEKYSKDTIKYYETYIKYLEKYIKEYNKDKRFVEILKVKKVTVLDRYMYNYFFHKDNQKTWKEIEKEFISLLEEKQYRNALSEVNNKYLSLYNKVLVKFAKKKNIYLLKFLWNIKRILKGI